MKRLLTCIATISLTTTLAGTALADEALESALSEYLSNGSLAAPIKMGMKEMAGRLAETECEYQLQMADSAFIALKDGASTDELRASNREMGEPNFLLDFIDRQDDFKSSGATAAVKARIVQAINESCASAAQGIVAAIPGA